MNRTWKVLLIGLGSAGQRHMRNLRYILGDNVELMAYRTVGSEAVYDEKFNIISNVKLSEYFALKEYYDFDEALSEKPDIVFVTNPNSCHIQFAVKAAKAGSALFIEKPLSNNLKDVKQLIEIVQRQGITCNIGYQNRLHPCIQGMKEYLECGALGRIVCVHAEIGELLSKMHNYGTVSAMNESQEKTGGGVVLCQSHELDYLYYLFGLPKEVYSIGGKAGDWDIDVEDTATSVFLYHNCQHKFAVTLHQDYFQSPPRRFCTVVGTEGRIEIDLLKNQLLFYQSNQLAECKKWPEFQRNEMFLEEVRQFLTSVENRKPGAVPLQDGLASLIMALAVKKSYSTGRIVSMEEMYAGAEF